MLQVCKGFSNWKDATISFKKHEGSGCHREAVEVVISLPVSCRDVGAQLSQQYANELDSNRKILLKILSCIKFLGRQGLALRGDGDESDGNFLQLLKLQADEATMDWLQRKCNKYTSHEIQNEILKIMALNVLRNITLDLQQSPFLTIMIDETTDISNREQVTIVIRRVNEDLEVFEEFLGLYHVESIAAEALTAVIKDSLVRMNLSLKNLRGQCYDGCSTMSGKKSGVAKRISDEEERAVFTHCYGHSLSLAACDSVKRSKIMKNALETTHEITKLIKYSPRRDAIFSKLKAESDSVSGNSTAGIRVLCPTRWTVRADALLSIKNNYSVLLDTWDEALQATKDTESKARIHGVQAQMRTFDFIFGTVLGEIILRHTDNLSRTLQSKILSAAEGQEVAGMVVHTLEAIRDDASFDIFWIKVGKCAESLDISDPELPRRRRAPRRFEDGLAEGDFHTDTKAYYRQHYFEAVDLVVNCIKERFDQPGYRVYRNLEQLLLKAAQKEDFTAEFDDVCSFYKDDFNPALLHAQLLTFGIEYGRIQSDHDCNAKPSIFDVKDYFTSLIMAQRSLLSEVCKVVKLVLVMPATNATSERSFSALRRVKNYLRSTMTQQRLNNLLVLHVHKDITDNLKLKDIVKEFVGESEHRQNIFGKPSNF